MLYLGEIAVNLIFGALALVIGVVIVVIGNGVRVIRDGDSLNIVGAFTIGRLATVAIYTVVGGVIVIDTHDLVPFGPFTVGSGTSSSPNETASPSWYPRSLASGRRCVTRVQIFAGAAPLQFPIVVLLVQDKEPRVEED